MKANKIDNSRRRLIAALLVLGLVVLSIGGKLAYDALREVSTRQCVIRDMAAQVEITSGKMVHPSTIAEELGLKVGKNIADIDFSEKRKEVLAKIPNLLSLRITRHMPDRVSVLAEERTPIAKLNHKGQKSVSGKVIDAEGMVFMCQRGTQALPTIFEPQAPSTRVGLHVSGRTKAALRLVEVAREPDLLELGILAIDTSKPDFLIVTLGNYSKLKILWESMDDDNAKSRADLVLRLTRLRDAIRCKITPGTVIWNATIPDKIFADTQGAL